MAFVAGVASLALSGTLAGATAPPTVTENVQGFFAEQGVVVDTSAACGAAATVPVAYMPNELLLRTSNANPAVISFLNTQLRSFYGTIGIPSNYNFVQSIERIRFPKPTPGLPITDLLAVVLKPRPNTVAPHDLVGFSRFASDTGHIPTRPNYALSPSGPWSFYMPNGLPVPSTSTIPDRPRLPTMSVEAGTGTTVEIYDTGMADRSGVVPDLEMLTPGELEVVDADGDTVADLPYAVHGVAIGSVIETLVPGASVSVARISEANGVATDRSAARRMASTMRGRSTNKLAWPDLMINAFGTPACALLAPIGLEAVVDTVEAWNPTLPDDTLFMASAGNYGVEEEFYPAAFDDVIAVGALDGTIDSDGNPWTIPAKAGPIAEFSNRGDWVDLWVPGVDLPVVHANGVSFEQAGVDVLKGVADVDGTSFALPYAASLVLEEVGRTGADPRDAIAALLVTSRAPLAECDTHGTETSAGRAISLPDFGLSALTPAIGPAVSC